MEFLKWRIDRVVNAAEFGVVHRDPCRASRNQPHPGPPLFSTIIDESPETEVAPGTAGHATRAVRVAREGDVKTVEQLTVEPWSRETFPAVRIRQNTIAVFEVLCEWRVPVN